VKFYVIRNERDYSAIKEKSFKTAGYRNLKIDEMDLIKARDWLDNRLELNKSHDVVL
jgi:hypothetical protein